MCTFNGETEIMVCDVSRDLVRAEMTAVLGDAFTAETVHGEGTRFTCLAAEEAPRFRDAFERGQRRASEAGGA